MERTGGRPRLAINGAYTQTATGTLDLFIGGPQAGVGYGQLVVTGLATLGGTLNVQLANGYQPLSGDLFQPLLFAQGQGTFFRSTGDASPFVHSLSSTSMPASNRCCRAGRSSRWRCRAGERWRSDTSGRLLILSSNFFIRHFPLHRGGGGVGCETGVSGNGS
jgi:hypothetical protein